APVVRCSRLPVAFIAALVPGLVAAADVVVGRDARTAVALTVYSGQDLAVVRDARTVDLGTGERTVRFDDVSATLDPRSVVLRATEDAGTLAVLEQSYLFDLASPQALVERWVGRAVELVDTDQRLRTRITSATLLSTEGGNVYRIGDRIAVGHPGWLFLPPSGDEIFTRPTLRWQVANSGAGRWRRRMPSPACRGRPTTRSCWRPMRPMPTSAASPASRTTAERATTTPRSCWSPVRCTAPADRSLRRRCSPRRPGPRARRRRSSRRPKPSRSPTAMRSNGRSHSRRRRPSSCPCSASGTSRSASA